jgi:hypothetical protein
VFHFPQPHQLLELEETFVDAIIEFHAHIITIHTAAVQHVCTVAIAGAVQTLVIFNFHQDARPIAALHQIQTPVVPAETIQAGVAVALRTNHWL